MIEPGSAPLLLPALDLVPGQHLSPHAELLAARAQTLTRLAAGASSITIAPVAAAIARTETPAYYHRLTLRLKVGEEVPLDDLATHLESVGYERRDPVETPGDYSIRGGILDVFSPEQEQPVRIEFFGDQIESIRRFDAESQRSVHKLNECVLEPLSEFQKSRSTLSELSSRLAASGHEAAPFGEAFAGLGVSASRRATGERFHPRFLRKCPRRDRRTRAHQSRRRTPLDSFRERAACRCRPGLGVAARMG